MPSLQNVLDMVDRHGRDQFLCRSRRSMVPNQGAVESGFEPFVEAFGWRFRHDEVEDELVAKHWGGYREKNHLTRWTEDTLACTISAGKAVAAAIQTVTSAIGYGNFYIAEH